MLEQQVAELRHALANHTSIEVQKLQLQMTRLEEANQQLQAKLESSNNTIVKLAAASRDLYDGEIQALSTAQNILKASKANQIGTDVGPAQPPETPILPAVGIDVPPQLPEFDIANPQESIDALTTFNTRALEEAVIKIGSNARKYLKLSKEYR